MRGKPEPDLSVEQLAARHALALARTRADGCTCEPWIDTSPWPAFWAYHDDACFLMTWTPN